MVPEQLFRVASRQFLSLVQGPCRQSCSHASTSVFSEVKSAFSGGFSGFSLAFNASRRNYGAGSSGYQHFDKRKGSVLGLGPIGLYVLGGLGASFGAYYISCRETIPYTHRKHAIMFVTQEQERALGKTIFRSQLEEARQDGTLLPPSHPYSKLVERIGRSVAAIASNGHGGGYSAHMKDMEWEFAVINSPVPNAFVVPGGKVVVYSGLLRILATEEELAAVLAHETGHVLARHHAERISTMSLLAIGRFLVYLVFGIGLPSSALFLGIFLPYSRLAEHEADLIGLSLMAQACYDPQACTSMLSKLEATEKSMEKKSGSMPAFLRTHPLTEDRVKLVNNELPQAKDLYRQCGCGLSHSAWDQTARHDPRFL